MFLVDEVDNKLKADIRIIGVGGGGNNAIETMIKAGIQGVTFIAINTDAQSLSTSSAEVKIQLGEKLTKGLGAGANPEVGRRAAMESYEEIVEKLKGADMVFITAGMGGGTGSGGSPVVAEVAKDLGILTVGIVTYPFLFEGNRRRKYADASILELKKQVDTLITIPNEKLLDIADKDTSLLQSFKKTDEILLRAVKGIAELVSVKGLINLDFADVKTIMADKGMALMSIGMAKGQNRSIEAISQAISSPLLSEVSIKGSKGIIVNITAGKDLSLMEVNQATSCLTKIVDPDADIIVGAVIDESMGDDLSITLIATGFEENVSDEKDKNNFLSKNLKEQNTLEINEELSSMKTKEASNSVNESMDDNIMKEDFADATDSIEEESSSNVIEYSSEESVKENSSDTVEGLTEKDFEEKLLVEKNIQEEKLVSSHKINQMTLRDKLLLKAKEYGENKKSNEENPVLDHQISIDWEENSKRDDDSLNNISSSPFESNVDFSDEDIA